MHLEWLKTTDPSNVYGVILKVQESVAVMNAVFYAHSLREKQRQTTLTALANSVKTT